MNDNKKDTILEEDNIIELILPFKAEFVSIARLTTSGVSNRIGFDIETIEDIKVAVAEVCNKLINVGSITASKFNIKFHININEITITFNCEDKALKCIFDNDHDGLGISIINALMDKVEFCNSDSYLFSMSKTLEGDN